MAKQLSSSAMSRGVMEKVLVTIVAGGVIAAFGAYIDVQRIKDAISAITLDIAEIKEDLKATNARTLTRKELVEILRNAQATAESEKATGG
jgi:hypothetical protein